MKGSRFDEYRLHYWYDGQIRRYNIIFTRIFANFQYAADVDEIGNPILRRVPVRYALKDNVVAYALRNANENSLLSVPMFTVNLVDLEYDVNRIVDPLFSEKIHFTEKKFDEEKNAFINEPVQSYTLERFSPVPYTMRWEVHLWTSNQFQKEQLIEQIIVLFNPSIQLQFSENPLDWTSLTEVFLEKISYSSNTIPVGAKAEIEITTMSFYAPVWFTPPAILEQRKIIETVVTNIVDTEKFEENLTKHAYGVKWTEYDLLSRHMITLGNHSIHIEGDRILLAGPAGNLTDEEGNVYSWKRLVATYGSAIRPGTSLILINPTENADLPYRDYIKGSIDYSSEENVLIWNIDPTTIPLNTLSPIKAVIDPTKTFPGHGLPLPIIGDRYLLLAEISDQGIWNVKADRNDIIEYDGTRWVKVFDHHIEKNHIHYLTNLFTNRQLKWNGKEWVYSIDGFYGAGQWRLAL